MIGQYVPPGWAPVIYTIEIVLLVYFIINNGYYLVTGTIALLNLPAFVKLHLADPLRRSYSTLDSPVSFVIPAFNEVKGIVDCVKSALSFDYPNFEVIVVNDGSHDETLTLLTKTFGLVPYEGIYRPEIPTAEVREVFQSTIYPNLRVVDKVNGGKGDALNAGVNLARYPLVFTADADTYYERQALQWMVEPFQKDPHVVATGGAIAIGKGGLPKTWIERFQVLEYMRAFLATRLGFAPLNALGIISGAAGLWRREILVAVGGFRVDTIWEDMEMTLRVHNYCVNTGRAYRVAFSPFPICRTEVPANVPHLFNQRKGWHRHVSECMAIHRRLIFGNGGWFSWITMPYFLFFEWMAPIMVIFGISFAIVGGFMGFLNWTANWWLLGLVFLLALLGSIIAILLDEMSYTAYGLADMGTLFLAALLENFGYRQIVTVANFLGIVDWVFKLPIHGNAKYPGMFVKAWAPKR